MSDVILIDKNTKELIGVAQNFKITDYSNSTLFREEPQMVIFKNVSATMSEFGCPPDDWDLHIKLGLAGLKGI